MTPFAESLLSLRRAYLSGKTKSVEFRITQLRSLLTLLQDNETALLDVLDQDLRKVHQQGPSLGGR
ncbi:hypothetical protein chiPu_0027652, partial [Chiloscyllium punctatum]|nr:hypothetical protein [Chiloscyllium punctatum]